MSTMHRRLMLATLITIALAPPLAAQEPTKPVPVAGRYDGGFLVFQSADSAFKYWLDGRLQLDGAFYSGNKNELGNGTEVRRARFGFKATLFRDWHGEMDIDFAANAVEMKDMWFGYEGFPNTELRVGNFKEPFGLETLTSSKMITFIERAYPDNFSPDRTIGVAFSRWGDQWQLSGGLFGQAAGTVDASGANEGYGLTGRFSIAPIKTSRTVLHLGLAASRRTPDGGLPADANQIRYRARPETNISKARFVTTGKIKNADHSILTDAEFAFSHGPFLLQAEGLQASVDRKDTLKTATFHSGYVMIGWMITGETRPYVASTGEFERIVPRSSKGAWELAGRVSTIDLNDFATGVRVLGGKATNYTLGVNWHINTNFKWMLNYVWVVNDNNAKPDIGTAPFVVGDAFNIFATRFAIAF